MPLQQEDVEKLLAELENPETRIAEAAGRRLIEAGSGILPPLLRAVAESSAPVRRRVAFILGELPAGEPESSLGPNEIAEALHRALEDADWKVRRNAAMSLGKAGQPSSPARIAEKLKTEREERVRASMILAFGKLAAPEDAALFAAMEFLSAKEEAAALKVAGRFRGLSGAAAAVDADRILSAAARVELWCRGGVAELTAQEAAELGLKAAVAAPDRVRITSNAGFGNLLRLRTALYPTLVFESEGMEGKTMAPELVGRRFSASPVALEMKRLTSGETPHYRLTLPGSLPGWPLKRDWIAAFAAGCHGLVNAATGYSWEIVVKAVKNHLVFGARPATCPDSRFLYRKAELPASVHPTVAAAAVRLIPAQADDTVLDPFCGSGVLLAERAVRGPYRRLVGIDIDPRALKAAAQNLAGWDRVSLRHADTTRLSLRESFNAVISNPPYGQRVGTDDSARKLHQALDTLARAVLKEGGFLVALRPPGFADPAGMELLTKKRIDAGGMPVNFVVARKRPVK